MSGNILMIVSETICDAYACFGRISKIEIRSKDLSRDLTYLASRFQSEGLTFLTTNLPKLGDWFDKLVWGELEPVPAGFHTDSTGYPTFLRPFWKFFQNRDVHSYSSDDAELYRILRTLLLGLKKLDVPFTEEQVAGKLETFLTIEEELKFQQLYPTPSLELAQRLCELWSRGYVPSCPKPKHGPGAVAGGERIDDKWNWSHFYSSVHAEWPYWEYLYPVRSVVERPLMEDGVLSRRVYHLQLAANAAKYRSLKREDSPCARLLFVPKDSRGPRIISCEPKELMYIQQGVSTHLMNYIESHPYTRGHVNFVRQDINADLALLASKTKEWDTIDLSDASDRVSTLLVTYLFPREVTKKWHALRSTATLLPDGKKVPLHKFAPMGSALCFPVESLVFWALAVASVWEQTGDLPLALESVYVYGDDIIVRSGYTSRVMDALEHVDLKVNRSKSFIGNHPFRESCGIEALNGFNVTPFRVKKFPPRRPSDGTAIMAWVKYAENSQYICPKRSCAILKEVEIHTGPIPRTRVTQPFISIVTEIEPWDISRYPSVRWSPARCLLTSPLLVIKNKSREIRLEPLERLQRNLIEDFTDRDPSLVVDRQSTLIRKKRVTLSFVGA